MSTFSQISGTMRVNRTLHDVHDRRSTLVDYHKKLANRTQQVPQIATTGTIFMIDRSGSMGETLQRGKTRLHGAIKAAMLYANGVCERDPNHLLGLIAFDSSADTLLRPQPVAGAMRSIEQSLLSLAPTQMTDFDATLRAAERMAAPYTGVKFELVMVTDGWHNGHGDPAQTAEHLKSTGHGIAAIGVGASPNDVQQDLLERVVSSINGSPAYEFCGDLCSLLTSSAELARRVSAGVHW